MSIVGMDPNSVIPAANQLKNAGAKMYDAASKASIDLFDPMGLPSNLYQRAMELGSRSNGCITSADAMATHSIDLGKRAAMFHEIEQDTGLEAANLTAANGGRPLWNHDTRHTAMRDPSGYWTDVDAGIAPAAAGRSAGGETKPGKSAEPRTGGSGKVREIETFVPDGEGIHGSLGTIPTNTSIASRNAGAAWGTEVPGRINAVRGMFADSAVTEELEVGEAIAGSAGSKDRDTSKVSSSARVSANVGLTSGGAIHGTTAGAHH